MKFTRLLVLASLMLAAITVTYSQESHNTNENSNSNQQTEVKNTPSATVTIKSGGNPSYVTSKVIELAEGDNETAEKVVRFIKREMNPSITKIVSDEKYDEYNGKVPEGIMSESEVIELINEFK